MIYPTVQLLLPPQYVIQCLFSSLHSQPRKDFSPSSPCSFPLASSPAMEAFLEFLPFLKNLAICLPFIVVQLLSNVQLFATHGLQHAGLPCPSLSPRVWANSCPLSQWCDLTISSFSAPLSFYLQSFPASGSFPISQIFVSGGQSIGNLASASVLPMSIQGWFPLGLTGYLLLSFYFLPISNFPYHKMESPHSG